MSESLKRWKNFVERTKEDPPRPLLIKALRFVGERENALDLGAGALNDSRYLLQHGFKHVIAVDKEPAALEMAQQLPADKFEYRAVSFEGFQFPKETFDLINAQYALPFAHPADFEKVFQDLKDSLKKKGVLTAQFFGDRDEWATNPKMTFHEKTQVERLLEGLTVIDFKERELDGTTAVGDPKHWHVFHVIAQK